MDYEKAPEEYRQKNRKLTNNFEKEAEEFCKNKLSDSIFIDYSAPTKPRKTFEKKSQVNDTRSKSDLAASRIQTTLPPIYYGSNIYFTTIQSSKNGETNDRAKVTIIDKNGKIVNEKDVLLPNASNLKNVVTENEA